MANDKQKKLSPEEQAAADQAKTDAKAEKNPDKVRADADKAESKAAQDQESVLPPEATPPHLG